MKKFFLCVICIMMITALAGCGNKSADPGNTGKGDIKIIDKDPAQSVPKPDNNTQTADKYEEPFTVDPDTGFFSMDTTLFGLTFNEFKQKVLLDDGVKPEDWTWWGHDLKVVYVVGSTETYACFFQNDRLVTIYRDSATGDKGKMYDEAVTRFGEPAEVSTYWNGLPAYEWNMQDFRYQQHVESYDNEDHYRQQYISRDYEE